MKNSRWLLSAKAQLFVALLIPMTIAGCSDPEPTFEQQLKLKELEMQEKVKLAEINANKQVGLANAKAQEEAYDAQEAMYESQTTVTQQTQPQVIYQTIPQQAPIQTYDQGYDGSSVALGILGGAVAGYYASELLDGGWSTGYDDYGNTVYRDSNNRVVSADKYKKYKTTHKVTKSESAEKRKNRLAKLVARSKQKAKQAGVKAKQVGQKAVGKAKPVAQKAKQKVSEKAQKIKPVLNKTKEKAKAVGGTVKKAAGKAGNGAKKFGKTVVKKAKPKIKKLGKKKRR